MRVDAMASLTLKNIPEPLLYRLRAVAARENRSLNRQVIEILRQATEPDDIDVQAIIDQARELRSQCLRTVTVEEILTAIEEGRR